MARRMEISSDALRAIESCLGYSMGGMDQPHYLGMEKFCDYALNEKAYEVFSERCIRKLVVLKGQKNEENDWDVKYKGYFNDSHLANLIIPYRYGKYDLLPHKARGYFQNHAEEIINAFIRDKYENDMAMAVGLTGNYLQIRKCFVQWFEKRREKFLENMGSAMEEIKKFQMAGKPQSHGGVANLLKALTKTMEKQGADIGNIAKVQYAVCLQAGIYIPSEFIQDVAVAMEIIKEADNG